MHQTTVITLDLNFQGNPGTIASYLLPHAKGAILIETGPGSTLNNLEKELTARGFQVSDITDVFVTHIHLDHAGAAGWLADRGAIVHVHPLGAAHLANPEKLLLSASRIYGEQMDNLWGNFFPVRMDRLHVIQDGESVQCSDLIVRSIDVPGHANHQYAYIVGDVCFSGDIGGIRVHGLPYINIPMPPPEFHLEKWRTSILRLQKEKPARIVPTHFGVYDDATWHLEEVSRTLDQIEAWMQDVMSVDPSIDVLRKLFIDYEHQRALSSGLDLETARAYQIANPSFMSADGILRYWKKFRTEQK